MDINNPTCCTTTDSFTINRVSVGPDSKERQYFAANYRQVLTRRGS